MSMAPAPPGTPDRTAVGIHSRCLINRIFFHDHGWWRYNDRPLNDNGGSLFLDNNRRRRSVLVRVSFPLIAWTFAIGRRYPQISGHNW
jgi:hypothetical protein